MKRTRARARDRQESSPRIPVNSGDWGCCLHVLDCAHSGETRGRFSVDLKAFSKLQTDPSTQGRSLTGTTSDQTLTAQQATLNHEKFLVIQA